MTAKAQPLARERRPTLYLMNEVRAISAVFLDTEVDMSRVRGLRERARDSGGHYSVVSFVLLATARALARHPAANAAIGGRRRPRVLGFEQVSGKLTFDKTINGQRVVLATVLPGLETAGLDDVQATIDRVQAGDAAALPDFAGARLLHRLPTAVGSALFRRAVRPLGRRAAVTGTFAVTSLGHRPVDGFYSVGGTTITIGVGRIADRPAVRDGAIVIAPLMQLNLTFDHRVIDGAEAADLLADIKTELENYPELPAAPSETPAGQAAAAT